MARVHVIESAASDPSAAPDFVGQHWEFVKKILSESEFKDNGCILYRTHWATRPCITYKKRTRYAARRLWELLYGEIPKGLSTLHSCDNGYCINLDHIRLGTQKENIQDMLDRNRMRPNMEIGRLQSTKTHCPNGHPYNEEHTLVLYRDGKFRNRYCKTCKNTRRNARYVRKRK